MAHFFRSSALVALAFGIIACLSGCEHPSPERAVATAAAAPPQSLSVTPLVAQEAPHSGCVVPLPDPPAPKVGPADHCPADPSGPPTLPRGWVTFAEAPGAPRAAVEVAATDPSRERGLMFRTAMPEDQGMIFDWADAAQRSFWMRNTCIPLDMLFIAADGTISGILEQVPPMDESPRGVPCAVTHVLELNAGWCRAHGVKPGQRVRIES